MYPPRRYTAPWDRLVTRITPNTRVKPLDTRKMIPASVSPFRVWAMNCCTLGAPLSAVSYRARAPAPRPSHAGTQRVPRIRPGADPNMLAGAGCTPFIIISVTTGGAARQRNGSGRHPGDSGGGLPGRSAGAGLLLPGPLVAQLRQQALEQPDLGAVEPDGGRVGGGALLGLGEALLRRAQLLAQLGVLLGQPLLVGPDAGQLLLQAGHGPGERDIAVRGPADGPRVLDGLEALHRQRAEPLHYLQQQPPSQLVVVEVLAACSAALRRGRPGAALAGHRPGRALRRHARPGRHRGRPGRADPVGALAAYLALDQARPLHARQQLRERDAGARIGDRLRQRRARHAARISDFADHQQVRHDAVARADRPPPA